MNAAVYQLVTQGVSPLQIGDVKNYLRISTNADDALIDALITAALTWGEKYTGREFTNNTWNLLLDCFESRIRIRRDPVDSITYVNHLVSGSPVAVDSSIYYLKANVQYSEILLKDGEDWPTDTDDIEQAIEIRFITKATSCIDQVKLAMLRHIAFLYMNRGDCSVDDAAKESGAKSLYDLISIPRV